MHLLPKSNSGMWNSKMSLRLSAFLYGGRSKIPHCVRNRLRNLMKYNEIVPLCEDSRETEPHPAYWQDSLAMTRIMKLKKSNINNLLQKVKRSQR